MDYAVPVAICQSSSWPQLGLRCFYCLGRTFDFAFTPKQTGALYVAIFTMVLEKIPDVPGVSW